MKYLALLVSIIFNVNCFSQNPNPQLFQTWYLSSVDIFGSSFGYSVSQINPTITPSINFSTTPSIPEFTGTAACNSFSGGFMSEFDGQFQTAYFSPTALVCSPEIHNSFETSYFNVLSNASHYQIIQVSSGLLLIIINQTFGQATFKNFILSTNEFNIENIVIYPNPVSSEIAINSNQLTIEKINVINSYGQIVKTINDDFEVINVSDLSSGIYILKIYTELGIINKKIIKE